jgi:hypothetical protein
MHIPSHPSRVNEMVSKFGQASVPVVTGIQNGGKSRFTENSALFADNGNVKEFTVAAEKSLLKTNNTAIVLHTFCTYTYIYIYICVRKVRTGLVGSHSLNYRFIYHLKTLQVFLICDCGKFNHFPLQIILKCSRLPIIR